MQGDAPGASRTITTRNELIAALHEAAELEHGLLLQYLYAAFSLKQTAREHVTDAEFAALRTWKGILLAIAVEEMGHLGTVCNLLAAIGAPPHFGRPDFPQLTACYPFALELVPFGDEALRRFVAAERPRRASPDGMRDEPSSLVLPIADGDCVPCVPTYEHVAELYDYIREGMLAIPECQLFIGSPTRQVDNDWSVNVDMRVITDRRSAFLAIEDLVRDGEGTIAGRNESHYGRFCAMLRDFRRAPFEAARPIVRNPRTCAPRAPTDTRVTLITDPVALAVAKLFNAAYALMLRLLAQFFSNYGESAAQRRAIREAAAQLMSTALRPLAEVLTSLPAGAGVGNAGPTFELYAPVTVPPEAPHRFDMLLESLDEFIAAADLLAKAGPPSLRRVAGVAETISVMRRSLHFAARRTR
jgi:hypothetical protein